MLQNSIQEAQDREKEKPKIRKARKRQTELEKQGKFVKVEGAIGNLRKFVKDEK